jgi:hypothetical protein
MMYLQLLHAATHLKSQSDNSSDEDSCCTNCDAEAGQPKKMVVESILIGEKVPVEEVMKCVHNLHIAIACEDPEMRRQVF